MRPYAAQDWIQDRLPRWRSVGQLALVLFLVAAGPVAYVAAQRTWTAGYDAGYVDGTDYGRSEATDTCYAICECFVGPSEAEVAELERELEIDQEAGR